MTITLDGTETAAPRERDGLIYPFAAKPEPGKTIEVAPGIHWIRLPLPFQLNHINVWLIEDGAGWALVDTGINSNTTKGLWEQVFAHLGGRPVTRVIVTHLHPDHVGLAGWLTEKFDVPLYMSRTDYLLCRTLVMDTGQPAPEEGVAFYKAAGFPDDALELYRKRFGGFGMGVHRLPQSYRRLSEGQELAIGRHRFRIVVGRGHAPEHACLWSPEHKVMISGDQILPRISSNVSVFPTEPEANPLQEWLDSCAMLKKLIPDDTLICPAHNEPFYGVARRMTQLIDDHESGMTKVVDMCASPQRAVDVFPALFRTKITSGNYGMATGESLAHLNCLIARGKIVRTRDGDGVDWYRRV
ncbi:MAG: MBL fold metallo-hydrolase [Alphaproteobacteria bacterium]|nr:MBL fold metallo-hydrolase [Alphaproteobacteria bacterium]